MQQIEAYLVIVHYNNLNVHFNLTSTYISQMCKLQS
jgi:hypothetical protein